MGYVRGFGQRARRITRGAPNNVLGRPISRMVAPTLAIGAELKLIATPLSDGDSWIGRLNETIAQVKNGDYSNLLQVDSNGNNILSVLAAQIEANAGSALVMAGESVILSALGRFVGA